MSKKNGWYYSGAKALTGNFEDNVIELDYAAHHMKIKTDNTVEFSFDGVHTDGKVATADGMQTFLDVNKGKIWLKGTGNAELIAWDGN